MDETLANVSHEPTPIKRLVVLVPGFRGSVSSWEPLLNRLRAEDAFAQAKTIWLPYEHGASILSFGTLEGLAQNLAARIQGEWVKTGGFDDILLVGHSLGGLIVRRCFLIGAASAAPGWASRVQRIVLMASVNRGLDWQANWSLRVYSAVGRLFPFLSRHMISQGVRGAEFLTNLRIDWIRYFSQRDARNTPVVVQLLGTRDSFVMPDDSRDVLAFPNGHYISIPDATHKEIPRLDLAADADTRYALLKQGFLGDLVAAQVVTEDKVRRVVFILHGIRDSNVSDWVDELKQRICRQEGDSVYVVNPTYGFFTAARFALPSVRRKNIRVFQDWYTEALAKHPTAQFDVVAHSNGTYLLGHSLLKTPGMRFNNVALAGSGACQGSCRLSHAAFG